MEWINGATPHLRIPWPTLIEVYSAEDFDSGFMKHFREDLHRRLLSTDFRKQVDGLEMLQEALPSSVKEMIELVDILLRWFVLHFCESNTTCLLKVPEFHHELLDALKEEGYTLTEVEAAMFLLCLVQKISGLVSTDEGSKDEQAWLFKDGATGYNTFYGYPPEVVKKMPKKDLAEEEKLLCRVCFEGEICMVLLPCRHCTFCKSYLRSAGSKYIQ